MTSDLVTLVGAVIGVTGLVAALATLQPLLLPLVVVAYVPAWLAASRNSHTAYRFGWGMTPNDRRRYALSYVLSGKAHAAEVRAFQLAGFLGRQYDDLYDERVGELRTSVRERSRRSLVANGHLAAVGRHHGHARRPSPVRPHDRGQRGRPPPSPSSSSTAGWPPS